MNKTAISVYNPSDPLERAIQNAHHAKNSDWLNSHDCQLAAQAIRSLKIFNKNWINSPVINQRASYFFHSMLTSKRDQLVFVTHPLYLRDILENKSINSQTYYPITFVTTALAHYIFNDYPVHIHVKYDILKQNNDFTFDEIGGLVISENHDVLVDWNTISRIQIKSQDPEILQLVENIVDGFRDDSLRKAAASLISPGVFKIDEHTKYILPSCKVWDKIKKTYCTVSQVDPGESGLIHIKYDDSTESSVVKNNFDQYYSFVSYAASEGFVKVASNSNRDYEVEFVNADTNNDIYKLQVFLRKSSESYKIRLIIIGGILAYPALDMTWTFEGNEGHLASRIYHRICDEVDYIKTEYDPSHTPVSTISAKIREAVKPISIKHQERTNIPSIDEASKLSGESDWLETLYSGRYPNKSKKEKTQFFGNDVEKPFKRKKYKSRKKY